jgi:hypothetical protein
MSDSARAKVPKALWAVLVVLAVVSLIAEVFVHHHAAFGVDGSFGFYAWYTWVAVAIGVAAARLVALVLGRSEADDA